MTTVHIIDEVVFDFSYDSIAIAREHESDINTWLTDQLLPVVDSILNTYDDAQTVLRLDHLELDLGDISNDDFHSEIMRKVSEQLADQLHSARHNYPPEELRVENSSSAAQPFIKQVSQTQTDSERLKDFLLTGNMAWHIDTLASDRHEKMLMHALQQTDKTFIQLLRQSSSSTRNVLIKRLVKQFSPQHLERVLAKLAPASAGLISDLIVVVQTALAQTQSDTVKPEELTNWLRMLTIDTLLEDVQESDRQAVVLQKILQKFEMLQTRIPDLVTQRVLQTAERLAKEQKINANLPDILSDITRLDANHLTTQYIENKTATTHPEQTEQTEQSQPSTITAIYQRIAQAIIKAKIHGIDATAFTLIEPDEIRQQLLSFGQHEEMRTQFVAKLPERVLLDIVYLLSPQAAALIEQLLAQSKVLVQAIDPTTDASKQSGETAWKQQLWIGSLTVLMTAKDSTFDATDFIQKLTRGFSSTQKAPEASAVVQSWYMALEQSQSYGSLHNILQQLVNQPDNSLLKTSVKSAAPIKPSGSPAYQQLYQRLTVQAEEVASIDLQSIIDRLTTESPQELRRIFQALLDGELSLTSTKLKVTELQSLAAALIKIKSPDVGGAQQDFVRAIESYAEQAKDQTIYYQRVLEALLHGKTVDLDIFASQVQDEPTLITTSTPGPEEETRKTVVPTASLKTKITALYQRFVKASVKTNIVDMGTKASTQSEPGEINQQQPAFEKLSVSTELQTVIDQLATNSPQELRRIFQALRDGELLPISAKLKESELLSLIAALIKTKSSGVGGTQQDFVRAIESHAEQAKDQTIYYQRVLEALLYDKTVDLEAFALQAQDESSWIATSTPGLAEETRKTVIPTASLKTKITALYQRLVKAIVKTNILDIGTKVSTQSEPGEINQQQPAFEKLSVSTELQTVIDQLATNSPQELRRIFQALRDGELLPISAKLKESELLSLIAALIKTKSSGVGGTQQDFVRAIESHAEQAKDQTIYYQRVLEALLHDKTVDLEVFASQVLGEPVPIVASTPGLVEEAQKTTAKLYMYKGNVAIYQRIIQAIIKADIQGTDTTIFTSNEPNEIRQQLLSFGQHADTRAQLTAKLPERVLLDIAYLLSPQAAALIEQLLVQSKILIQSIDATKQSSEAAWKQQLWTSSLTVLMMVQERNFDAADTIQELARWFSSTQDASAVVQGWYTALEQSQSYGSLHNILQQLVLQPNSRLLKTSVKSETPIKPSASSAYQQLYQRFTAQAEEVASIDIQSIIDKLLTDSPEELRRIFRALRDGELPLTSTKLKASELRSLIAALIKTESPDIDGVGGAQQDFVRALESHAEQAKDQTIYYQQVLEALLHGETIDLEVFASQVQDEPAPIIASTPGLAEKTQMTTEGMYKGNAVIYQRIVQAIIKADIQGIDTTVFTSIEPNEIRQQLLSFGQHADTRAQLAAKLPERVLLDIVYVLSPQMAVLIEQLLAQSTILVQATTMDATKQSSEAAWKQQLWTGSLTVLMTAQERAFDAADTIQKLARWFSTTQEALEASAVVQGWYTALEQSQNYGSLHNILQQLVHQPNSRLLKTSVKSEARIKPSGSPAYQQLYQRFTAQADEMIPIDIQSIIDKLTTDNTEELLRIFHALRDGELSLTATKLKASELQSLAGALIKIESPTIDGVGGAQQDFINAIESHAEQAEDQAIYYQRVFEALLQREIVDLEAFALQRTLESGSPKTLQSNEADNSTLEQEEIVSAKKPPLIILDDELGFSSDAEVTEEIYINNAGQVLAAPYLPRLFSALKLVEDGAFVDRQCAERAVHLLQFMVNEQTQSPEYQLLLNKLLCGITTGIPICREIVISEQEKEMIEGLIQGMIQNWKTIGNTTISGLRQTFLQRKGKLQLKDGMWYLTIEPDTFDMLLDGLPWSFSVIKHAWMDRAIHVTWR